MRTAIVVLLFCAAAGSAAAGEYVQGHIRSDGTYVQPHYRSSPDSSRFNNWSTQGNTNPYTGQAGTRNPYATGSMGGLGSSNSRRNLYGN